MSVVDARAEAREPVLGHGPQIALVDLLDRLLGTGVVLSGDLVISLAGVDLVQVQLHALISSVRAEMADPRSRAAVSGATAGATGTTAGGER